MFSRLLCALLAVVTIAACQPLPRPFEDQTKEENELLTLANRGGVVVQPILDVPNPAAFAETIAAELRRLEVPATTRVSGTSTLRLEGRARIARIEGPYDELSIDWQLTRANGAIAGGTPGNWQVPRDAWAKAAPEAMKGVAELAAPALVEMIEGDRPAARPGPALVVWAVDGAPGDGAASLKAAMELSLRRAGYRVLADLTDDSLVVSGAIRVQPAGTGRQRIGIVWSVLSGDGSELGQIEQENVIVAGLLDGPWGEIARQIAAAAIEGINEVLEQVRKERAS